MQGVGQTRFNRPQVLELPDPGPLGAGEVRVRMTLSPIGVAEVRALEGHRITLMGQVVDEEHPFVFGFAGVGAIEDPGASGLSRGQRVVVTPYGTCGACAACLAEDETQCECGRSLAGIDTTCAGMMREAQNVPARRVLPIPDSIGDEEGCYVSEVATAVHLLRRVRFGPGQSIAVSGCGRHGRLTILVARAMGASSVLGIDPAPAAREAALAAGADECRASPEGQGGYDVAIHCNALLDTIGPCCDLVRVGGTVGLLGTPVKEQPDAVIERFTRRVIETERRLVASASKGTASFRTAIDLMKDGMNLDIRHPQTVSLAEAPEQFMKTLSEWPGGRPSFVRLGPARCARS
jgi:threonine dehydrogenase-like Zn-dependent dehydrogenase